MTESKSNDTQYRNEGNLNSRVLIHSKYGVNKTPWPIWLFDQYALGDHARIMEFGCGTGLLWKANAHRVNPGWHLTLSDSSAGMIDAARRSIETVPCDISFKIMDLDTCSVGSGQYTNVIANHMLYHLKDRESAIERITGMLEPSGEFYCSTVGMGNMAEMKALTNEFTGNDRYSTALGNITEAFSLENGKDQLAKFFPFVEKREFVDSLEITDSIDVVNYVMSCNDMIPGITVLPDGQKDEFKKFLDKKMEKEGAIHISKSSGTFIARKK